MQGTTMGSRIEQARREQGLSVREVASRLCMKPATIENWERDRSEPRSNKLLTLAGVLNVPLLWLLEGEDPSGRSYHPEALSETARILQKLERAQAIQQEVAALLAEATADVKRLQGDFDAEQDFAA